MPSRLGAAHAGGITEHLERLGLQTYGKEREDPSFKTRRPIFRFAPVIRLYRLDLTRLFGLLVRDAGTMLDRDDPNLFDSELEHLLAEYGPLIWPTLGKGSRDHLRPEADLVYPRDSAVLKKHLRGIVLSKQLRPGTDVEALINKTHQDARLKIFNKSLSPSSVTPRKRKPTYSTTGIRSSRPRRHGHRDSSYDEETTDSESEDSVIGTKTRRQTQIRSKHSSEAPFDKIELRIYRKSTVTTPSSPAPVWLYGFMFLTSDCKTSDDFFSRICEKIKTDCSFVVFQLPEDMSPNGQVRIDRGSRNSETEFEHMLEIFHKARRFPGEPQYRSVETEVGLDMPMDD